MRKLLIGDFGYGDWKICNTAHTEIVPNGLTAISEAQYAQALQYTRGQPGRSVARVNGVPYIFGAAAENAGPVIRPKGAGRYKRDYLGVLAAYACGLLYPASSEDVTAFVAHPAQDIDYVPDLQEAIRGRWHVEIDRGDDRGVQQLTFNIRRVGAYPEPLGGLYCARTNHGHLTGFGYVLDIGAHTVQGLPMTERGLPDWTAPRLHLNEGIADALTTFEGLLRQAHTAALRDVRELRPGRLRDGLRTGRFQIAAGHNGGWDCENEATAASARIINRIGDAIQEQAGGAFRWDYYIYTGYGSAVLGKRVAKQALNDHPAIYPAAAGDDLRLANMIGGLNMALDLGF